MTIFSAIRSTCFFFFFFCCQNFQCRSLLFFLYFVSVFPSFFFFNCKFLSPSSVVDSSKSRRLWLPKKQRPQRHKSLRFFLSRLLYRSAFESVGNSTMSFYSYLSKILLHLYPFICDALQAYACLSIPRKYIHLFFVVAVVVVVSSTLWYRVFCRIRPPYQSS